MATFNSGGTKVSVELFLPPRGGVHRAVVVAYGTEGMGMVRNVDAGRAIRTYANHLASTEFVVLIPHYFERTNTPPGFQTALPVFQQHRDTWLETLGDCLTYALSRSDVDPAKIGLLGFSMGGHLALRRAKLGTGVRVNAVVEFAAPITMAPFGDLRDNLANLPPLQIHHGTADEIVPPEQSDVLEGLLAGVGKVKGSHYERHDYDGEGHIFQGTPAVDLSKQRTAKFFRIHLA